MPSLIVLCTTVLALFPVKSLQIEAKNSGKVLFLKALFREVSLELRYIHSVEKIPVVGKFRVKEDGEIFLEETVFPSFGPGLPFSDLVRTPRGEMAQMGRGLFSLEKFGFFIDPETRPVLLIEGRELALDGLARGEILTLEVKRKPFGEVMWENGKGKLFGGSGGS